MKSAIIDTLIIVILAIICAIIIILMVSSMNERVMFLYTSVSAGLDIILLSCIEACILLLIFFLSKHEIEIPNWMILESILIIPVIGFIILWYADWLPFTNLIFPYFSERIFQIILGG